MKPTEINDKLMEAISLLNPVYFVNTQRALGQSALFIQSVWQGYVGGGAIPGTDVRVNNSEYVSAIRVKQKNSMEYEIGVDPTFDSKATAIEGGSKLRDLKKEVATWKSRRKAKAGHYYAFIPFRHEVKDLQNDNVYGDALKLKKTPVMGAKPDAEGVKRLSYNWAKGTALFDPGTYKSAKGKEIPKKYHNMRRFQADSGKSGSSTYITFRTLSMKSPGGSWIIPAKEGIRISIVDAVYRNTREQVNQMLTQGFDQDFEILAEAMNRTLGGK